MHIPGSAFRVSIHVKVHANVLMTFDGPSILDCREETPLPKRGKQDLIQPRVLCGLDQFDVECTVRMDSEACNGNRLKGLIPKIVGDFRQRLREQPGLLADGRG